MSRDPIVAAGRQAALVLSLIGVCGAALIIGGTLGFDARSAWRDILMALGVTAVATALVTAAQRFFAGDPIRDLRQDVLKIASLAHQARTIGITEVFATRAEVATARFEALCDQATRRVLVLAYAAEFLSDSPKFFSCLGRKAREKLEVQVLLGERDGREISRRNEEEASEGSIASRIFTTLVRAQTAMGSEVAVEHIRLFDWPLYASIYVFDSVMVVCPALFGQRGSKAPALVLQEGGALFDSYLAHFWSVFGRARPTTLSDFTFLRP